MWGTISAIVVVPPTSRSATVEPKVGVANRRHRPSLVLRTSDAESRSVVLEVLSPRSVRDARRSIGPNLLVRSIEAGEGWIETRSACDSREAEGCPEDTNEMKTG